jgi:sugar fermentation stimulation protein A
MSERYVTVNFNLSPGVFIKRLNRFMALVEVDGEIAYAHLPNSGRLRTVLYGGAPVYLRAKGDNPFRRSAYTIFSIKRGDIMVIVDAQFSNFLAKESIGLFKNLSGYRVVKKNFRVSDESNVKLDLMLEKFSDKFYIEVKSVTHVVDGIALFPDSPTLRGRRHMLQLISLLKRGFKSGLIFSVQRPDAKLLKPNVEVDPQFTELLREAAAYGLRIFTLKSTFNPPKTVKVEADKPPFTF